MKYFAAFVVVVTMAIGCRFISPGFDIGVCTAGKLGPQIIAVKSQVRNCLGGEDFSVCLAALESNLTADNGKDLAAAIVICAVREFTGAGETPTSNPDVRERSRAYLDSRGVKS